MKGHVYILESLRNKKHYIGSTANLENRFLEHENGEVKATQYLRPWKLIFSQTFDDIKIARQVEIKLKRFKSRKIIEKIINDGRIKFVGV